MIALVTDSSSQIPASLARRLGVTVVAMPVVIDGDSFREGIDLHADEFYERLARGVGTVSTSQPSPGEMAAVYAEAVTRGATEIVSVHVGSEVSGTVNAARLAANSVDIPVTVVDSHTASFGVTCCVWAAADALARGASAEEAARAASSVAPSVGTAFIVQATEFVSRSGRFGVELDSLHDGIPVLAGFGTELDVIGTGRTVDDLCGQMATWLVAAGDRSRVAVCVADPATRRFADNLASRLESAPEIIDCVRYRVGPSVAAHTGPGTAGGFVWPAG